jgi:hypothetical protein
MSHPIEEVPPHAAAGKPTLADLPPVEAPSAGFIVQLFVIPAIVVLVVILVWLLFGKLAGGERDAMSYVEILKSPSANWRTAHELASLLQNDPRLSNDPRLLGELTDLLARDLSRSDNPQLTAYLALAVGNFQTLDARLSGGQKLDPVAVLAGALDTKYPDQVRIAAAISLAKQAARLEGKLDDPTAIKALGAAASHGDPQARRTAVYALNFFGGDSATRFLRERLDDEDRDVRYNAAVALGRRDDAAARAILREMLSPRDLERVIELENPDEKRSTIEFLENEALQSLQTAVNNGHTSLARALSPEIEELSKSGLVKVRTEAQALLNSDALRKSAR